MQSQQESPFSESQLLRALKSRVPVAKSISPSNYDNGYGPKKVRLFNIKTAKDYKSTERESRTKVNGKLLDKNNIFISLAQKGKARGRHNHLEQSLTADGLVSPSGLDQDYISAGDASL